MKTILLALGYWCLVSVWVAFGWMLAVTIQNHRRTRRITKHVMDEIEKWEPRQTLSTTANPGDTIHLHSDVWYWAAESRFTLYADSEAEAIARLIGERK